MRKERRIGKEKKERKDRRKNKKDRDDEEEAEEEEEEEEKVGPGCVPSGVGCAFSRVWCLEKKCMRSNKKRR